MKTKEKKLLLLVICLTACKMIFVGSNVDEGYGIEVAWRLARGDRMLLEMWEPHQTSAIFGAVLIKLFWLFTGGSDTGLVLYMHFCGICLQFAAAYFLYLVLRQILPEERKDFAFLGGCVYTLCYPKGVIAPEYSNLQNWFTTCCALCFILFLHNYRQDKGISRENGKELCSLVLSGVFLSGAVLVYPSMVLLYPVMAAVLCCRLKKGKWQAVLFLTLPCLVLGGIFTGYLFSYMSLGQIEQGISYVLRDGAHTAGPLSRAGETVWQILMLLLRTGIYYGAAFGGICLYGRKISMDRRQIRIASCYGALLISFVVQIGIWLFRDEFINQPQAELVFLVILAMILFFCGEKGKAAKECMILVIFSLTGLLAAILLSNFMLKELIGYLSLGAIGGAGILYQTEKEAWQKKTFETVMCFWILTLSFGRVWVTSQGSELHTTPFEIRNIQKSGPGIGIITNYMTGYRYNTIAEEWDTLVRDGESVFYVGPSSFYYMQGDVIISAPNTISTPVYDESLLDYWEMFPRRYPDVVLVESCYGEVIYPDDSFIMCWLNTEYGASLVTDYEYVRVYRK